MPSRILREGILTSERVDALSSWAAEVFYRRVMSVVDDHGRYFANPSLLRAACYPLKLDKVSNADVEKWLADCAGAALVSTYEVDGKRYLQMLDFRQQVRTEKSKFPPMPDECVADATQAPSKCKADEKRLRTKTDSDAKSGISSGAKAPSVPETLGDSLPPTPTNPSVVTTEKPPAVRVWEAYSAAWSSRYGVECPRNAQVNAQIARFVKLIPQDAAPAVAAHYVASNERFYVAQKHPAGMLVKDASKLYAEWATGSHGSEHAARQADRASATHQAAKELLEEFGHES